MAGPAKEGPPSTGTFYSRSAVAVAFDEAAEVCYLPDAVQFSGRFERHRRLDREFLDAFDECGVKQGLAKHCLRSTPISLLALGHAHGEMQSSQ